MVAIAQNVLQETEKRSAEKLRYTFNFRQTVKPGVVVEEIVTIGFVKIGKVPGSQDLVVSDETYLGYRVSAFFTGGTHGEDYVCIAQARMSDGQKPAIAFLLHVLDRTR